MPEDIHNEMAAKERISTSNAKMPESDTNSAGASKQEKKSDYNEQLRQDFGRIFNTLNLDDIQREFLKSRWLDQVLWMEGKAAICRDRHYRLRLITIIGGVIVPILVTLSPADFNFGNQTNDATVGKVLKGLTIALSGVVAVSSAVEEFFHYGDRWYNYRRSAESLKAQGWQFFQLTGVYRPYENHQKAFTVFAEQVEEIIQRDVEIYVTQIASNDKQKEDEEDKLP